MADEVKVATKSSSRRVAGRNLLDVPIAVSAFSGESLENARRARHHRNRQLHLILRLKLRAVATRHCRPLSVGLGSKIRFSVLSLALGSISMMYTQPTRAGLDIYEVDA